MAANFDSLLLALFYAVMTVWIGSKLYQRRRERSWTTWAFGAVGALSLVLMTLALRAYLRR